MNNMGDTYVQFQRNDEKSAEKWCKNKKKFNRIWEKFQVNLIEKRGKIEKDMRENKGNSVVEEKSNGRTVLEKFTKHSRNLQYYCPFPMCKKATWDASQKGSKRTTALLSSDRLKITFIFRIRSVARLWRGRQKLASLEKKMRNVVFESVTKVWLICDPFVTHLIPIYPVIHLRPICNNVWPICDL